jgi:hypothetical protein
MGWYTCTSRGGSRHKSNLEFREVEDVDSEYSVFTSPDPIPDPFPFQVPDARGDSGSDGNVRGLAFGRVLSFADIAREARSQHPDPVHEPRFLKHPR